MHITIEDMLVDGDRIAFRWMMSGTQQGPWIGRPATGKTMNMTGMNMKRLEGD